MTIRSEIETAIRSWRVTKEQRLELDRESAKIKKGETELKQSIMDALVENEIEGIVCDGRVTDLMPRDVAKCTDVALFSSFIYENEALHLLSFNLSQTAIREMEASGIVVPGIEHITVFELGDRKSK